MKRLISVLLLLCLLACVQKDTNVLIETVRRADGAGLVLYR